MTLITSRIKRLADLIYGVAMPTALKRTLYIYGITGLFYGKATNLTRLGGIYKEKFVACRHINKLFVHSWLSDTICIVWNNHIFFNL